MVNNTYVCSYTSINYIIVGIGSFNKYYMSSVSKNKIGNKLSFNIIKFLCV